MSHACHRFWKCYKTLRFCSLLTRCTIPCACHAKPRFNVQKSHVHVVSCRFWLGNVLRTTTACTFSTSQLPKLLPTRQVLTHLTLKSASRHNGVHFSSLIRPAGSAPAALASLLFDPPEPQIIGKTQCFATFLPFRAPGSSFFGDFLFLIFFLLLFSSLFDLLSSSLLFSDSSHLCFSSVHTVGSLTSKLPSANRYPLHLWNEIHPSIFTLGMIDFRKLITLFLEIGVH